MLEKMTSIKIELFPKKPKENEKLCDKCDGIGWLYEKEKGYMEKCPICYDGIIKLCPLCHQPIRGICTNDECCSTKEKQKYESLLSKAIIAEYEDVPAESKEMLYSDSYPYNEGYFSEIEELVEACEAEDIEIPEYVWSTEKIKLSMDAGSIIGNACEDLHENAIENIIDEEGLQEYLDKWCEKQTGVDSYSVDYKYAILTK